ncbi:hypothetical protein B0H16DRAFT_1794435 [Mycena metata]|uniref:Uncharacterized protein n=1 Tax=Mycena metata TaxID=1033252 RepID=A0AAD7HFK6_9AGAR|nr:hypothetical protein B0H16DRAFT_1794435 [Mycena metata]
MNRLVGRKGGNHDESVLAALTTWVNTAAQYIPIAKPSSRPWYIRKGEVVGHLIDPEGYVNKLKNDEERDLTEAEAKPDAREDNRLDGDEAWGRKTTAIPEDPLRNVNISTLVNWGPDILSNQKGPLEEVLPCNAGTFGGAGPLGHVHTKVPIPLKPDMQPISMPMYGALPAKREFIDKQMDPWFKAVIEPSVSPWGFPCIVVYRNGKPCLVIDYRKINKRTVPDEFPLPIADEEAEDLDQFDGDTFHSPTPFTELARSAEFTFVAPAAESKVLKRHKGHPDAPTLASSPEKKRVRETPRERGPPPRLQFDTPTIANPVSPGTLNDVFGPTIPSMPSTSTVGHTRNTAATTPMDSKIEVMSSDLFGPTPASTPSNVPAGTGAAAATKPRNLKGFFKVVTKEEKEAMQARDAELFRNTHEEREKQQREEKYEAELRTRENACERKRKSRANLRAEKIAAGWVPSAAGRKRRKIVELEKNDTGPSASSSKLAEDWRQYRGFREASRKNNKPQGRKRKIENKPTDASRVNWKNPLIWPHVEMAVAGINPPLSTGESVSALSIRLSVTAPPRPPGYSRCRPGPSKFASSLNSPSRSATHTHHTPLAQS